MSDRNNARRQQPEAKNEVHVVVSRYALALQRKNQKLRSSGASRKTNSIPSVRNSSSRHVVRALSVPAANEDPFVSVKTSAGAIHTSNEQQKRSNSKRSASLGRRASSLKELGLRPTPRPAFPTRISSSDMKEGKRLATATEEPPECGVASKLSSSSSVTRSESDHPGTDLEANAGADVITAQASASKEIDELELLNSVNCQLCFAEAKAEDSFRRQEQRAQSQMLAAWEILQPKLHQLQETSLRLECERHANLVETHIENVSELSAQLAEYLPRVLASISQFCTSVQIALNRLTCSGISCTNPLQLKQHMEALSLGLDNLLEWVEVTHVGDIISSSVSADYGMQRLSEQSATALLQIAHLVMELRVQDKSDKWLPYTRMTTWSDHSR
ncbi:hypothetical protein PHYPSEUDO_001615 [Phytophthora pseudosyringae]|uniref:Uncharacterized protein n=1 Tax=Phytophthora pseudosyringae TaxID=221518 RepID=A0A8T1VZH7_9STRA|nr:hypothetical protein PHYPSEUDO_001615 [Phytophthora pseudosyringae]